jgi:hypothetical protein
MLNNELNLFLRAPTEKIPKVVIAPMLAEPIDGLARGLGQLRLLANGRLL